MQLSEFNEYAGSMRIQFDYAAGVVMAAIHELWCNSDSTDKGQWVKDNTRTKNFWYRVCVLADSLHVQEMQRQREQIRVENEKAIKQLNDQIMQLKMDNMYLNDRVRSLNDKLENVKRIISE